MKRYNLYLDYLIPAGLVSFCLFQPFFYHGILDLFEIGVYLPFINEVMRGASLYRDAVIVRGPFEIYLPALLMSVFGRHLSVLHAVFYITNLLTLVGAVMLARTLFKTRLFTYLLIPVVCAHSFTLNYFKNWGGARHACGIASILFFVWFLRTRKRWCLFLSGMLTACGFGFSPEMGLIPCAAVFAAFALSWYVKREDKDARPDALTYLQGFSIIAVPFILHMAFSGALGTYLKTLLIVPRSGRTVYHFEILFPDMPHNPLQALAYLAKPFKPEFMYAFPLLIYIPLSLSFLLRLARKKIGEQDMAVFCATLYALGMYLGAFRQINGPQFLASLPGLFIIFFWVLECAFLRFKKAQLDAPRRSVRFAGLCLYLAIFSVVFINVFKVKNFLDYGFDLERVVFRQISRGAFPSGTEPGKLTARRAQGVIVPDWQAEEINQVVSYIEEHIPQHEPLFCFPDRGVYNFLADRPCWSRFCWMDVASYDQAWTKEFFARLYGQSPRYIVARMEEEVFEPFLKEYPIVQNRRAVREFISKEYDRMASFGSIGIYRIKDVSAHEQ